MWERRLKPALLVIAAGTASLTCLALPTMRGIVGVMLESRHVSGGSSGFRELIPSSREELGEITTQVACKYLTKISGSKTDHPSGKGGHG